MNNLFRQGKLRLYAVLLALMLGSFGALPPAVAADPLAINGLATADNPVAVGQSRSFTVSGGQGPYTVASANPGIARIEAHARYYMVWGVAAGNTQIIVTDATGARTQGTVYVGTTKPLSIYADAILLTGGSGELSIVSGNPPYTVSTSAHLSATLKGTDASGRVIYTLTPKMPGQGTVTVQDSKGLSASKPVTVKDVVTLSFPDLTGALRTIDVGQTTRLVVSGGRAPYTVTADNPALATVQEQSAGQYSVTGLKAGVVGIVAKDADGGTRSLSLTIRALPVLTLVAPDTLKMGTSGNLSLVGGAAPFTVTVSGNAIALTKVDDKSYTLTPQAVGTATVTVKDSKGTTGQKSITVTAPQNLSPLVINLVSASDNPILIGQGRSFTVAGGLAPYTVTSANPGIAQVENRGSYYLARGVAAGSTQIIATDALGTKTQATVYIAATKPLTISMSDTLAMNQTGELVISNGYAPFGVITSAHLSATLKGTDNSGQIIYTLTPKLAGQGTVTVKDNRMQTVTKTITVKSTLALSFPELTSLRTLGVGQTTRLLISGGQMPYTVTADNIAPTTILQQDRNLFAITGRQPGSVVFTVRDATGTIQTISLTVVAERSLSLPVPDVVILGRTVQFSPTGGTPPYTLTASINAPLEIIRVSDIAYMLRPIAPGTVTLTLKDAKGLTVQKKITIIQPPR